MRSIFFTSSVAVLAAIASQCGVTHAQTYTYAFAAASAGGVNGTIVVKYADSLDTTKNATITADLDFTGVNLTQLTAAQAACTTLPTAYAWHIHVTWPSAEGTPSSAGPYTCTPETYKTNSSVCEKGDLSGKVGKFTVDQSTKKSTGTWTDTDYPLRSENTAQWNIVLHAVCGSETPRVACAVGKYTAAASATVPATTAPPATTPVPNSSALGIAGKLNGLVVVATTTLVLLAAML